LLRNRSAILAAKALRAASVVKPAGVDDAVIVVELGAVLTAGTLTAGRLTADRLAAEPAGAHDTSTGRVKAAAHRRPFRITLRR